MLRHVADHEIPDGHVVDVFVVRPERGLRVIGRRPAGAVEDRAVFADKGVAGLRPDRAGQPMHAGSQTERGPARIDASQDRDDLSEVNRRHGNGAA